MKYLSRKQFSDKVTTDEEFDELVTDLLHTEPPASLVDHILSSVAKIPLPQQALQDIQDEEEGLIVRYRLAQPS